MEIIKEQIGFDDFNRADSSITLHGSQYAYVNHFRILNNEACGNATGDCGVLYDSTRFHNNQYAACKIKSCSSYSNTDAGPVVRYTDEGYYHLDYGEVLNIFRIYKFTPSGGQVILLEISHTQNSDELYEIRAQDNTISALYDGILMGSIIDNSFPIGICGLFHQTNYSTRRTMMDDFVCGNLIYRCGFPMVFTGAY